MKVRNTSKNRFWIAFMNYCIVFRIVKVAEFVWIFGFKLVIYSLGQLYWSKLKKKKKEKLKKSVFQFTLLSPQSGRYCLICWRLICGSLFFLCYEILADVRSDAAQWGREVSAFGPSPRAHRHIKGAQYLVHFHILKDIDKRNLLP